MMGPCRRLNEISEILASGYLRLLRNRSVARLPLDSFAPQSDVSDTRDHLTQMEKAR